MSKTQPCREAVAYTGYRDGVRRSCDTHHGPWPCPVTARVCALPATAASEWTAVIAAAVAADAAGARAAAARHSRDQLVANLVAGGVSMYRVSKVLGVSESGVRKMVDRAQ